MTSKQDAPAATQPNAAPTAEVVELLAYVLQDEQHNRLTPRVIDIAYTAFTLAKQPNAEDGGSSDWFNDTRPAVRKAVEKMRKDFAALAAPAAAIDASEQGEHIGHLDPKFAHRLTCQKCKSQTGQVLRQGSDFFDCLECGSFTYVKGINTQARERAALASRSEAPAPKPIARIKFVKGKSVPQVEWLADVDVHDGALLVEIPNSENQPGDSPPPKK